MSTLSTGSATRAVWQVSAGPASRSYADVFLKHGVALIGPGDAGPWTPDRDDNEFEGGFVRRFASEVATGDIFLLRTGIAAIAALGLVTDNYLYVNAFDDVNGWDFSTPEGSDGADCLRSTCSRVRPSVPTRRAARGCGARR